MAADFTNSPASGDTYTLGGKLFTYDGTAWQMSGGGGYRINKQIFTSNGTYTPTAGMQYCIIECVGAGGGGGGAGGTSGFIIGGSGGGGGAYSRTYATAAQVGASQAVTVSSTGGSGATAGFNNGTAGSDTSVGTLCVAKGGGAGAGANSGTIGFGSNGGAASGGTGDVKIDGGDGIGSWDALAAGEDHRGFSAGGSSYFAGQKLLHLAAGTKTDGVTGHSYGGGGTGGFTYGTTGGASAAGGTGGGGLVIITEFCSMPVNAPYIPAGMIWGLTLSNNGSDATNDIDIAAGRATDSTNTDVMVLASSITKQLDATWAVGTNAGGLDTGSIANTTYHVFLIKRPDTGVVDVLYSTSATSPTMPANYTLKRRIGSIVRSGAAILAFVQDGDEFLFKTVINNVATVNPGTSAVTFTTSVPSGIRVKAKLQVAGFSTSGTQNAQYVYVSDLSLTDTNPVAGAAFTVQSFGAINGTTNAVGSGSLCEVYTNTSAQARYRCDGGGGASVTVRINTAGWIDTRGRLA